MVVPKLCHRCHDGNIRCLEPVAPFANHHDYGSGEDEVIDRINRMLGSEIIVLGSQQYTKKDGKGKADVFANAIKHDHRSPNPTTRWSDVIKLT